MKKTIGEMTDDEFRNWDGNMSHLPEKDDVGKATENQKDAKAAREAILKGILDEVNPRVSFLTGTGLRFDIDRSFIEFADQMSSEGDYIVIRTFSWDGKRGSKPMIFSTAVRKESIPEYSEVTEDMWIAYITQAADIAAQQSTVAVPGGVPPVRMN